MAFPPTPPEDAELLKSVLSPLLDDFQNWFGRTAEILEAQELTFLSPSEQATLLSRIHTAQKQVSASQAIASVTDGQAGIDMPVVMGWHQLAQKCWGVALRQRKESYIERSFTEKESTETSAESSENQI